MSIMYVTEYTDVAAIGGQTTGLPMEPGITQKFTVSGTTAQSAAFATSTKFVRLHCDGICSIIFGTNPTATTSERRIALGQDVLVAVPPGLAFKVAAITNT